MTWCNYVFPFQSVVIIVGRSGLAHLEYCDFESCVTGCIIEWLVYLDRMTDFCLHFQNVVWGWCLCSCLTNNCAVAPDFFFFFFFSFLFPLFTWFKETEFVCENGFWCVLIYYADIGPGVTLFGWLDVKINWLTWRHDGHSMQLWGKSRLWQKLMYKSI